MQATPVRRRTNAERRERRRCAVGQREEWPHKLRRSAVRRKIRNTLSEPFVRGTSASESGLVHGGMVLVETLCRSSSVRGRKSRAMPMICAWKPPTMLIGAAALPAELGGGSRDGAHDSTSCSGRWGGGCWWRKDRLLAARTGSISLTRLIVHQTLALGFERRCCSSRFREKLDVERRSTTGPFLIWLGARAIWRQGCRPVSAHQRRFRPVDHTAGGAAGGAAQAHGRRSHRASRRGCAPPPAWFRGNEAPGWRTVDQAAVGSATGLPRAPSHD